MCCRGQMNLIWPSETVSALHFRGDSSERHDPDAWVFGHSSEAHHPPRAAPARDFQVVILHRKNLGRKGKGAIIRRLPHSENIRRTQPGVELQVAETFSVI
jgi:hypothetical protein